MKPLYVEPFARNQGVARNLLEFVRKDAFACGFHHWGIGRLLNIAILVNDNEGKKPFLGDKLSGDVRERTDQ